MYYPYLRGKQFELIAVRENAGRMSNLVIPVIEPVRSSMNSLRRALEALIEEEASFIVVANPTVGELKARHELLREELTRDYLHEYANWSVGWIAGEDTTEDDILSAFDIHGSVAIIHGGYRSGAKLADILSRTPAVALHVFLEGETSKLYRHHFADETRILIRDGFKAQRRNIDYPDVSHFSDLHITFRDEAVDGFGDYLIVGNDFSEGGGPAYAVALHLTFIDEGEDSDMFVAHFKSEDHETQVDQAGKWEEALEKLVDSVTSPDSPVLHSNAAQEFVQLHQSGHYPGLGYAKKISMQHHIELMVSYLSQGT